MSRSSKAALSSSMGKCELRSNRWWVKCGIDEDIFLRDGHVWTSAGITAGIDLTLAMVEEHHGHAVAMSVAKGLVLFLRRSGRQAQFSQMLKRQEREPARLHDLSAFILEHLDEPLPVETLADAIGMSARTLTRWCEKELGSSPAALVRRLRLEEAQRLLEQTSLPLKDIAARTLIGDASTLWRVFTRQLGVTPAEYRAIRGGKYAMNRYREDVHSFFTAALARSRARSRSCTSGGDGTSSARRRVDVIPRIDLPRA